MNLGIKTTLMVCEYTTDAAAEQMSLILFILPLSPLKVFFKLSVQSLPNNLIVLINN